jgi:hypothetical protein
VNNDVLRLSGLVQTELFVSGAMIQYHVMIVNTDHVPAGTGSIKSSGTATASSCVCCKQMFQMCLLLAPRAFGASAVQTHHF